MLLPWPHNADKGGDLAHLLKPDSGYNSARVWTTPNHDCRVGQFHQLFLKKHPRARELSIADPINKADAAYGLALAF
jgi:hypothetical protein